MAKDAAHGCGLVVETALLVAGGASCLAWLVSWQKRRRQARADEEIVERLADLDAPGRLGSYRVVRKLGQGGMGSVYEVRDARGQRFAAKLLLRGEDLQTRRFQREIVIQRDLHHPNIVKLLDWGEQDGQLYFVMEYVEGSPLTRRIPTAGMSWAQARPIVDGILQALEAAHSHGVVHRDLKPGNVMLAESGIKLLDFGLARREDIQRLTATGEAFGTAVYMPPEQLSGSTIDFRSDLYSLGILIFEMVTGAPPFDGPDTLQLIMRHLTEAPPPLAQIRPELPRALTPIVGRMLAKEPGARPTSAAALRAELAAVPDDGSREELAFREAEEAPTDRL